jgi:crossover junction endodeoxyribonuclease RuvC
VKIVDADRRLAEMRGVKALLVGPTGVGNRRIFDAAATIRAAPSPSGTLAVALDAIERGRAMRVVGVEPGINGGLSVIEITDGAGPVLVSCIDRPVIGVGAKERVDVAAIKNFIEEHKPIRALIERAQAMPKQGASSGFKYGRAVGAIEATIALCLLPAEIIEPSIWKRRWHLPGKNKESGRQKALQLFPDAHAALARKRDHGRAEAALIALYYVERQSRIEA